MGYDAFISYSHGADLDLAPVVRDGLQRLAKPWNKRRALSIFLDQSSLELSSELGSSLDDRLKDTRWLVLFLSAESARSHWVGQEIAEWAKTKSKDQMALVLTSGEIVWDADARDFDYERSTAVSEGMRNVYTGQESEPLYLDLRWTKELPGGEKSLHLNDLRFRDAIATLAAPIHGIPKDQLEGEDVRQHRKARRLRRAAVSGLAVLTVVAVVFGLVAVRNERRAQRQLALTHRDMGVIERDTFHDPVKASQHFMIAAASYPSSDSSASRDAQLAGELLVRNTELQALMEHGNRVISAVFDPDESRVLSRSQDGAVSVWDAAGGDLIAKTIHETVAEAEGALFAEDATHVFSWHDTNPRGGGDRVARMWHAAAPRATDGESQGVEAVTGQDISDPSDPEGVTCDRCKSVVIASTRAAAADDQDRTRHGSRSLSCAGRVVEVRDASGGTLVSGEHQYAVAGAAFSHDGTRILSWDGDYETGGSIRLWKSEDFELIGETEHIGDVMGSSFSRDDTRVLIWGGTGQTGWVRLYKPETGEVLVDGTHHGTVNGAVFSRHEERVMSWGGDRVSGWVRIWDANGCGAILDDGSDAWTWMPDGRLQLASSETGERLEIAFSIEEDPEEQHGNDPEGDPAVHSHNGEFALTDGGGPGSTLDTGEFVATSRVKLQNASKDVLWEADVSEFDGAVFSGDDARLAIWGGGGDRGWIRVVDVKGRKLAAQVQHRSVSGVVFGPGHDRLLSWGDTVQVWSVGSDGVNVVAETEYPRIGGASFNRDGTRVLSWAMNRVWLWQADTGVLIAENICQPWVEEAVFSDDETHVLWRHGGGLRLWRVDANYDLPRENLVAGVEARTGTRLDLELGRLVHLSRAEWLERKRQCAAVLGR